MFLYCPRIVQDTVAGRDNGTSFISSAAHIVNMLHPLANPDIRSGMLQSAHFTHQQNTKTWMNAKPVTFSFVVILINVMFTGSYALLTFMRIMSSLILMVRHHKSTHSSWLSWVKPCAEQCWEGTTELLIITLLYKFTAEIHGRQNDLTIIYTPVSAHLSSSTNKKKKNSIKPCYGRKQSNNLTILPTDKSYKTH